MMSDITLAGIAFFISIISLLFAVFVFSIT